ncbi:DegT/DnrJ/EryC1/StrS aminotransferase family protein [Siccirubricoccus sp. G192]|uniref:DegT/DnrJ/EryC1/StrS family aminotransferase n=1 Tax=Siccirubricoccus sp. G192 TaxID=2849651 RepID=UPI001C2B94BF|nr:DegT/DnrJ/EryC1/StrS aminotransferase family protein [Siccirubricoccus sp. G192]MBV1797536.1 DegT/DnrJ/EryC1/StrS aminotransferase family protein [Siccirubricoccus sp. G192]
MLLVAQPELGAAEKRALCETIDSGWITMGPRVQAFEEAFAARHGAADAVAVGSCTAALHLILAALDIGPGDEVLAPSLTFVATTNSILYVGATPVFVDIDALDRPLLSLAEAEAKVTPRTKAIILVHFAGRLADPAPWREFAERHGLYLVEDAAHVIGVEGVGTYGEAAAFSFYGNKNMTTAEGGMVLSRSPELLERIRRMRGHGMTSGTFERVSKREAGYDVTMLGYNYRMDELRAAIGLVQLEQLPAWNERRRALRAAYANELGRVCPAVLVPFDDDGPSANHIMPVLLPRGVSSRAVAAFMREAKVQTTMHYPAIHQLSYYRDRFPGLSLPVTEEFCEREITLPLHPSMGQGQVTEVAEILAAAIRGQG